MVARSRIREKPPLPGGTCGASAADGALNRRDLSTYTWVLGCNSQYPATYAALSAASSRVAASVLCGGRRLSRSE